MMRFSSSTKSMTGFICELTLDSRADRTFPHRSDQPEIAAGVLHYSSRAISGKWIRPCSIKT
jgi:hypothetical protein